MVVALSLLAPALAGCHPGRAAARTPTPVTPPVTLPVTTVAPATLPATTTTAPLPPPPYAVVTATLAFVDSSRPTVSRGTRIADSRALTTVVWAPAVGHAWPLVVFAPGYRVGPDTYTALCRAWAAAGYVVAAPEFPLADPAVAGAALDEGDLDNEPGDVKFVIDSLVAPSSPLAALINPSRVAVAGHSDGAEAALAVAQEGDGRIRAVIAMSGQPVVPHRAPNPPLLVIQGDRDTINPAVRSLQVYQQAAAPRFLLTLLGASHLAPFSGGSKWQSVVEATTVDFWNHYLAARTANDAALVADAGPASLAVLR